MIIKGDTEELIIDYNKEGYTGYLLVNVGTYKAEHHNGAWIINAYFDNSVPLTNDNIDKIVDFFNKFRG